MKYEIAEYSLLVDLTSILSYAARGINESNISKAHDPTKKNFFVTTHDVGQPATWTLPGEVSRYH